MKTFLVWILISVSNNGTVEYSPPLREYKDCVKMQDTIRQLDEKKYNGAAFPEAARPSECIQVDMVSTIANPIR